MIFEWAGNNLIFWRISFLCVLCYKSNFIPETPIRFFALSVSLTSPLLTCSTPTPHLRASPTQLVPFHPRPFPLNNLIQPVLPQNLVLFSASFPLNLPVSVLLSNWTLPQSLDNRTPSPGPEPHYSPHKLQPLRRSPNVTRNRKPSGRPLACRLYRRCRRRRGPGVTRRVGPPVRAAVVATFPPRGSACVAEPEV